MKKITGIFLVLSFFLGIFLCPVMAAGKTYYVDSEKGNDNNNGLTSIGAWKSLSKLNHVKFSPGDRIALKAGSVWNDAYLKLSGSGTKEAPIMIDMYGEGARPAIHTNGKFSAAVSLSYVEGWEIRNLELTNYSDDDGRYRRGVFVETGDCDARQYFRFQNLYIHDVNGAVSDHNNGGIIMRGYSQNGKKAAFHDVMIENCTIRNTDRNGIRIVSDSSRESSGIVIRNNFVDTIGGDGIVTVGTNGALIERNVAKDCFYKYQQMPGVACVAIWTYKSDNTLIQYNEAYNTHCTRDGEGFDSDYNCMGSVFQYNYSHDNEGGFMLICNNPAQESNFNTGTIVRYNISQNDRNSGIMLSGNPSGAKIYNNTIYIKEGLNTNPVNTYNWNGGWADDIYFANNIFYDMGTGSYKLGQVTNCIFENNLFWSENPQKEPYDPYKIQKDPLFFAGGSAGVGRKTVQGYRIMSSSPCIGKGIVLDAVSYDYFGTDIAGKTPDVGAIQYVPGFFMKKAESDIAYIPLKLSDQNGKEITELNGVNGEIMLNASIPEELTFMAACYEKNGELKNIALSDEGDLKMNFYAVEGDYLKVFLWDSEIGNLEPAGNCVIIR